ncbi:MAG: protein phosphatase 2C domain-containing protein [Streptosporangiales bacterium]|nr:protein phosphatase 2C domain-containing protein [Streptosporangiales bacterium]
MAEAPSEPLTIQYGVRSDVGLVREGNEDSVYAGGRLLVVADGMGGHAHGEVASATAIEALRPLDIAVPDDELLPALEEAVLRAGDSLHEKVEADPELRGMGTTLTALLWSGSRLGLAHIGDSRAYLVRAREVFQITRDHTLVQSLVDDGKITEAEMETHPKRNLLLRALDGEHGCTPDLELLEAEAGDRYLLSSDGLHGVVSSAAISRVLLEVTDPDEAASELVRLAIEGGAPDNVTVIVADVVPAAKTLPFPTSPEPADA